MCCYLVCPSQLSATDVACRCLLTMRQRQATSVSLSVDWLMHREATASHTKLLSLLLLLLLLLLGIMDLVFLFTVYIRLRDVFLSLYRLIFRYKYIINNYIAYKVGIPVCLLYYSAPAVGR